MQGLIDHLARIHHARGMQIFSDPINIVKYCLSHPGLSFAGPNTNHPDVSYLENDWNAESRDDFSA